MKISLSHVYSEDMTKRGYALKALEEESWFIYGYVPREDIAAVLEQIKAEYNDCELIIEEE